MKVHELVDILLYGKQDVEVKVQWEGIFVDITPDRIYHAHNGKLVIDADESGDLMYKDRIVSGDLRRQP
jgi:hypothetical protein